MTDVTTEILNTEPESESTETILRSKIFTLEDDLREKTAQVEALRGSLNLSDAKIRQLEGRGKNGKKEKVDDIALPTEMVDSLNAEKYDELLTKVQEVLTHNPDSFQGKVQLEELRQLIA